jgi:hypothetical protein
MIKYIKEMNNVTKLHAKQGGDKVADTVKQKNSMKQGCTFSPYLFI